MGRLSAGQLLCETISELRERVAKSATETDLGRREYHALKIAASLRLLLLDERPLLVEASAPYGKVKTRFRIRRVGPDSDSEAWFANDLLDPGAMTEEDGRDTQHDYAQVGGLQVWNRVLTPEEIRHRYEQGRRRLSLEQTIGYQTLLRQPLVKHGATLITVRDVVRFLAHVGGGVHHGVPESSHEEEIDRVCETFKIQELPAVHASMFAVARIVARGLEPLEARIRESG